MKKRIWKKNFKEHKEALQAMQALQRDMSEIKRSLQGIENTLGKLTRETEGTNFFNVFLCSRQFVGSRRSCVNICVKTGSSVTTDCGFNPFCHRRITYLKGHKRSYLSPLLFVQPSTASFTLVSGIGLPSL